MNENKQTKTASSLDKSHKPELLKNWKAKLFVFLLCAVSFGAGWQASRSYAIKDCWQSGGKAVQKNGVTFCERSSN